MGGAGLGLPARRAEVTAAGEREGPEDFARSITSPTSPSAPQVPCAGRPRAPPPPGLGLSPQKRSTSRLLNGFKKQEEKTGEEKTVQSKLYFLP